MLRTGLLSYRLAPARVFRNKRPCFPLALSAPACSLHSDLLFLKTTSRPSLTRIAWLSTSSNMFKRVPVESLPPEERGRYKIATIPNALCIGRIAATPLIGYLVVQHNFTPAFALFIAAGLTDMLDGFIARNVAGQKSLLGSVLDPMADKLLVSVMFITMTHAELIPLPLTAVVILRDVCLIAGGFYKRFKTMEPPYSLNRFFNPEVSSIEVVPTMTSKINTVLQLLVVASALACPVFDFGQTGQQMISYLGWITAATTISSGLQYASGRAFRKI